MKTATNVYYIIAAGFIVYFIISYAYKVLKIRNIEEALLTSKGLLFLNLKHFSGIILFGILFFLIAPEFRFLVLSFEDLNLISAVSMIPVLLLSAGLAYTSVKKRLKVLIDRSHFQFKQALGYFGIRTLFLFSYEFFFRGVIFFSCLGSFNLLTAISITTVLYVLIHSFDSRNEILGAIPFGIVLCLFSYNTNSIWPAFLIHLTLSGVYEFTMFRQLTLKPTTS
jgi:membrane protease YdiL (CAAX protease family)